MPSTDIDIPTLIDSRPYSRFQIITLVLCGLCVLLDGFDVQVIGFVAPAIVQAWHIDRAALGPVFASGLIGLLTGSLVLSVVADRIGRRPVLIGSMLFFGVCMVATGFATSLKELLLLRFLTGLGLGSIMPIAMALAGEYSRARNRVIVLMAVSVSFTAGAAVAGFVAAAIIPRWGWQMVFYAGGALPLALAAAMAWTLPESLQFLVLRGKLVEVGRWLRRINPEISADVEVRYRIGEPVGQGVPVRRLFTENRGRMTLLLWGANLLNLLNLFFLSNWLPTIIRAAGLDISTAVLAGTTLQVGGTAGAILMSLLIGRAGFRRVLIPCFAVAAIAIYSIGRPDISTLMLFAVIFTTGFCILGGQSAVNALAASYYPTALRSTGIGWALGIGRLGSILGPVIGGEFLRLGLSNSSIFLAVALPAAASVAIVWAMRPKDVSGSRQVPSALQVGTPGTQTAR